MGELRVGDCLPGAVTRTLDGLAGFRLAGFRLFEAARAVLPSLPVAASFGRGFSFFAARAGVARFLGSADVRFVLLRLFTLLASLLSADEGKLLRQLTTGRVGPEAMRKARLGQKRSAAYQCASLNPALRAKMRAKQARLAG